VSASVSTGTAIPFFVAARVPGVLKARIRRGHFRAVADLWHGYGQPPCTRFLIDRSGIRGFHRYRDSTWVWSPCTDSRPTSVIVPFDLDCAYLTMTAMSSPSKSSIGESYGTRIGSLVPVRQETRLLKNVGSTQSKCDTTRR
jgi:hypothetical protein